MLSPTGANPVVIHSGFAKIGGSDIAISQSELYAIILACEELSNSILPPEINFFSDSQAALKALNKRVIRSQVTKRCWEALDNLGRRTKVKLRWIKAHVGYYGNELADEAAKKGALESEFRSGGVKPSKAFYKRKVKESQYKDWNSKWTENAAYRQTKLFYPVINPKKSKEVLKQNRKELSKYVRFITGHNFLNRHNLLVNPALDTSKLCRNCGEEEETGDHIIK